MTSMGVALSARYFACCSISATAGGELGRVAEMHANFYGFVLELLIRFFPGIRHFPSLVPTIPASTGLPLRFRILLFGARRDIPATCVRDLEKI